MHVNVNHLITWGWKYGNLNQGFPEGHNVDNSPGP